MRDFLSNLVKRSLGTAATLQRRRPGIFEPRVSEHAPLPELTTEHEPSMAASLTAPFQPSAASQPKPQEVWPVEQPQSPRMQPFTLLEPKATTAAPRMIQPAREQGPIGGSPRERHRTEAVVTRPEPHLVMKPIETVVHTREIIRETMLPETRLAQAPAKQQIAQPVPESRPTSASQIIAPPSPRQKGAHPFAIPNFVAPQRESRHEEAPALLPKPAITVMRPGAPAALARPSAPTRHQQAQPSPTAPRPVSINIGSIEIRTAAPAIAPQQKVRSAGPKLKLDDYLAARHGSSR